MAGVTFCYKAPGEGVSCLVADVPQGYLFGQGGSYFVRGGYPTTDNVLQSPPNEGDVFVVNAETFQPGWARGSDTCTQYGKVWMAGG